jgi:hypothetical protein
MGSLVDVAMQLFSVKQSLPLQLKLWLSEGMLHAGAPPQSYFDSQLPEARYK